MEFEPVIGLEVHVQLRTRSKMFCGCAADSHTSEPNSRVCPVCLALPGSLPVINRRAVEFAIMTGLALNCRIARTTKFDRKNYPYPDLMKGYQISQYDMPICENGWLDLLPDAPDQAPCRIRILRVHMEEDVAKLMHVGGPQGHALMDVNRSGVPLMEIVSEPDIESPAQAEAYITQLQSTIRYLGVSTANMEEGSFRCDANISLRPKGTTTLGTKVEVKNMNRVRAVGRALEYEVARQADVLRKGGRIEQETRGWVDDREVTVSQRSKEQAHDYRYFPEPDLPPLEIDPAWVEEIRARLPELAPARKQRITSEYGLSDYDASLLTAVRDTADYFEAVVAARPAGADPKSFAKETANWINGEFSRLMNAGEPRRSEAPGADSPVALAVAPTASVRPADLASLVAMFQERSISNAAAKQVLAAMFETGRNPATIVEEMGLRKVSDAGSLEPAVEQAIASNPAAVDDYMKGKEAAIRFLVGQVMRASRGRADPVKAAELILEKLGALKKR
ncbi:MAG: Asp-tRNA(Asn)/Glu-tRNA(Gln) amidotransferase subunit GatB [Chloroflexi bacterium]|nr:Asp-tRNA(Asn)/Glu-tRNA(Gln) amidotransferase subunit GatB [Chloroflexota bacterium]